MMKISSFEVPYFINRCRDHDLLKNKILQIIDEQYGEHLNFKGSNITRSDYFLKESNANFIQPYVTILHPYIVEHLNLCKILKDTEEQKYFYWYNQYTKLGYQGWHDHQGVKWASVYYLELDRDNPPTEFRNFLTNEVIRVDVTEGDIITFPGFMEHRSPPNNSNKRKTIIACNLNTIH